MKTFGGILGILGGLLGVLTFYAYVLFGPAFHAHVSTGSNALLNILGGIAALTCLGASVAIISGPGRMAGFCLLAAGLIAMFVDSWIGTPLAGLLVAPAVAGGALAAVHGRRAPRHGIPPRSQW